MISRTVGLYPHRAQPTFPLLCIRGNSRAYQPNREKFKGSDPFSFLPYWGFVIGHNHKKNLKQNDYGKIQNDSNCRHAG